VDGNLPDSGYTSPVVPVGSPLVRERYPRGVAVDAAGFPDWTPYARALVRLPEPPPGLTVDELRVVDVLAANAVRSPADAAVRGTPAGWTWAHLGATRGMALVPVELHAAFRHPGGRCTLPADRTERGLRIDYAPEPVGVAQAERVPEEVVVELERHLGFPLPPGYRRFLAATNGAAPDRPGVQRGFGFLVDQRFFGLGRDDYAQDLIGANRYVADRFTEDVLAIGYVQGGTIAVTVRGPDADAVWYWDDDDPRAEPGHDAAYITEHLLYRCADTVAQFWERLAVPAVELREIAAGLVRSGQVTAIPADGLGAWLPASPASPASPAAEAAT